MLPLERHPLSGRPAGVQAPMTARAPAWGQTKK